MEQVILKRYVYYTISTRVYMCKLSCLGYKAEGCVFSFAAQRRCELAIIRVVNSYKLRRTFQSGFHAKSISVVYIQGILVEV